jgi:hypothetical protein
MAGRWQEYGGEAERRRRGGGEMGIGGRKEEKRTSFAVLSKFLKISYLPK